MLSRLRAWRQRCRCWRQARQQVRRLFDDPQRLAGTSLKPAHRGRVDVVDVDCDGVHARSVLFVILRHPRPYPFSRQFHAVMQLYRLEVASGEVRHQRSLNLSRKKGGDGEPAGH